MKFETKKENVFKPLVPLNLQFFSDANPEGEEQKPEAQDPTPEGAANPTSTDPTPAEKTFTQEEVNRLISERINREKNKFSDYEELIQFKKESEEKAEKERLAKLDEIERAQEEAKKAKEENDALLQKLANLEQSNKRNSINNEFIKLATAHNIAYVDDAITLAASDLSAIELDENGKPIGVDAIVSSLIEKRPYLVKTVEAKPLEVGGPASPKANDEVKTIESQLEEAKKKKDIPKVIELSNKLKKILNK